MLDLQRNTVLLCRCSDLFAFNQAAQVNTLLKQVGSTKMDNMDEKCEHVQELTSYFDIIYEAFVARDAFSASSCLFQKIWNFSQRENVKINWRRKFEDDVWTFTCKLCSNCVKRRQTFTKLFFEERYSAKKNRDNMIKR